MPTSQFFGLMIGYSGLTAYQAAENTLANNVANVETEGYSRQYVARTAADALRTNTSYGMQGAGVKVTGVKQYRNIYYDNKYWTNNANVGRFETHEEYMIRIEKYFEDSQASNGFNTIYDSVFSGLEELKKDPGQTSTRTAFLGTAQTLTEYFRTLSDNLKKEQQSLNEEIKSSVERINTIAGDIASLNKQINTIELTGSAANELRDKRALLVDELSQIVDVTVTETPVVNESDKDKTPTGANRYIVQISNGNTLVNGYETNELEVVGRAKDEKTNMNDIDGLYDVRWKSTGSPFSVLADNLSGSLKSLFELRDGNNNENLQGKMYDRTDSSVVMEASNLKGSSIEEVLSQLNIPETGVVNIGGYNYNYESFSVKLTGDKVQVTFDLPPGVSVPATLKGQKARVGQSVDYQGIPYYMAQMNQWVRQFAYRFNDREKDGENLYGKKMELSFFQWRDKDGTLRSLAEDDERTPSDSFTTAEGIKPADPTIPPTPTAYYFLTAENFYVNQDIIKDPKLMSTAGKEQKGDSDVNVSASDIVDELAKIRHNKSVMEFRGCSSSEFLTCILSDISLNSMSAKTFKINSTNIQSAIQNQRDSISSVDDDEEALDLVKFQNAYNLNAKIIQTMTEIYDRLILQTGV